MVRILITDGIEAGAKEKLLKDGFEVVERFYAPDDLGAALQEFDVLVVRSATRVSRLAIDQALKTNRLKLIIRAGVGLDNIDAAYAREKGIQVSNTPMASSVTVAELTIAHMLAVARFLNIANVTMREGKWEKKKYKGVELRGKTLGLVGFGRIAREVAPRAEAFGMRVIYTDLHPAKDVPYEWMDFDEMLQQSDFVSLHCPYNPERGTMITEKELALMKPSAYLINCSRGNLVSESALLAALNNGKLAGAGLDVFEHEPSVNQELLNHPRVSVTPHIGASTVEAQQQAGEEVVRIIRSFSFDPTHSARK
ncbi:MAG TPA: D-2-hydroxyacid dehydrogenase [Syntrophomonas sp.]|nr:D-2-hydroxyacid dehydrogenase [Syntrophomonas sp.]